VLVLDRKIAMIALCITAFFFWNTFSYPPEVVAFPRFLLVVFFILSLLLFLFPRQKSARNAEAIFSKEKLVSVVMLIGYAIIFPILGYFITTFLFAVSYLWYFRRNGIGGYLAYSFIFLLIMYAVFQKWLYVWFPEGLLF